MSTVRPFAEQGKYTEVHNYVLDHIMPEISPNAWKCLSFIIRKTKGWHKQSDDLSFTQIKKGTGIKSDPTISKALKQLESKKYILIKRNSDQWTSNTYILNTALEIIVEDQSSTIETIVDTTIETIVGSTIESIDTKERYKENKTKGGNAPAPIPAYQVYIKIADYHGLKRYWINKLAGTVGDDPTNLEFWRQVVEAWTGKGWNGGNVKGMLEYYERREIPGQDRKDYHSGNGSGPAHKQPALSPEKAERLRQLQAGEE